MKTIFLLVFLNTFLLAVCTSSNTNPGYLYNKPDIHTLVENTSKLSDVVSILGEPATSEMTFRKQLIYKYYYYTPSASVNEGLMIKRNYSEGCKGCGQIIIMFKWGEDDNFNNFIVTEIIQSDHPI